MIQKIWLKLFLMVLFVVLPLMTAQYLMQKESITLVSKIAAKSHSMDFVDQHLENLKRLSRLDPDNAAVYRDQFEKAAESRNVVQDLELVQKNLIDDLLAQTLRNMALVLLTASLVTYWIARSIVKFTRRLIEENRDHSLRLERMSALESWQKVARMMVHEMRAPITPIKLVATDIESKYQNLDASEFQRYLGRGAELIRGQVEAIERLTENLTRFAKLPDVQRRPGSISEFLNQFAETYKEYGSKKAGLQLIVPDTKPIAFDAALLNLLFFNLLKNAVEANPDDNVQIQIRCRQDDRQTRISFANSGSTIPKGLASEIFKLHISTKENATGSNFGVGLTIAKKIALDHNGDLWLARNDINGVEFDLELPNV